MSGSSPKPASPLKEILFVAGDNLKPTMTIIRQAELLSCLARCLVEDASNSFMADPFAANLNLKVASQMLFVASLLERAAIKGGMVDASERVYGPVWEAVERKDSEFKLLNFAKTEDFHVHAALIEVSKEILNDSAEVPNYSAGTREESAESIGVYWKLIGFRLVGELIAGIEKNRYPKGSAGIPWIKLCRLRLNHCRHHDVALQISNY